jgi:tetratricopeptide (TPR) repeat protein
MQIKRDYSQSFFRERRRPPYFRWFILLVMMGGLLFVGYTAWTEPLTVRSTVNLLLGERPTPTPFASVLANQAQQMYWAGDLNGAARLYTQALEQRPDDVDYLFEYGQILIDNNEPAAALELAERILAQNANDVRGIALRARALVWDGQYNAAIPIGLAGIAIDNTYAPLYEALSRAYTGASQWREGLDYGARGIELAPDAVRMRWAYANALMAVGARDEAIIELETAVSLHPTFVPPYFELAFLYLSLDRDREAIDVYDRILGMNPRNARALLRQCEAYRKIGEFERALGLCQDAVNADPSFVPAQMRLGLLRYNRREFTQAREAFQMCLNAQPDNLECLYRLGLAYYYVAETQYQDCQNASQPNCAATSQPICQQGQGYLDQALDLARLRTSDVEEDLAIINEGLAAITYSAACGAIVTIPPTPTPEITPEPTPES